MAKRLRVIYTAGQLIGDCTFISDEPYLIDKGIKRRTAKFKCVCGKEFIDRIDKIAGGGSKGCGCRRGGITHRCTIGNKTDEYKIWCKIKDRCKNKNDMRYGGRGIAICDRWLNSFENFLEDMDKRPSTLHSIERIDNNGNYEPSNCRWATKKEQARNRRSNVFITYNNETLCINEWAERSSINQMTFWSRIFRYKWSIEKAINHPIRNRG